MIHHFFYQQIQIKPELDYSELFKKECSWIDLISDICKFTSKITNKLTLVDVKILRVITQYKRYSLFKKIDYLSRNNILILKIYVKNGLQIDFIF